ncbi:hypothetical protein OIU84_013641 [Salix udensis]|uniref:H15 domain-containing protein n=1 Tax=Salix udensis TaxID=889485 RepID=A0AAD6NUY7_9ROSI|nr:hypothetical protein OIU84_013641 [Salix udensis]
MSPDEPTVAVDGSEPTSSEKADDKPATKPSKTKKTKESKAKKGPAPKKPRHRAPSSHPPYEEMIKDAIVTLKEKTGSSQYAITKFLEEKHKQLPSNFKKLLLFHLKKLVISDKIVKVKGSFKLPSAKSSAPAKPAVASPVKKEDCNCCQAKG